MKVLGWEEVPFAKLKYPGDWKKRLSDPAVPVHAKSQEVVGIIHEPLVRKSDWKLILGCRRVAGALYRGEEGAVFKLVDCTDEEAELLALFENAHREHMSSADQKRLIDLIAEKMAILHTEREKETIAEPKKKRGRMKLPRTMARELIQEATGRTKEAQRKAEQRVKEQHKELAAKVDHDADIGIRSPWADLDDDFRKATNEVVKMTHEAGQLLSRTLGRLTMLTDSGHPLHKGRLNQVKEEIAMAAKSLRGLIPTCLCPYCKGVAKLQEAPCHGCFGAGYITEDQEPGVPKELWEVDDSAVVAISGKFFPYAPFVEEALAVKADEAPPPAALVTEDELDAFEQQLVEEAELEPETDPNDEGFPE